jgi:tetratricopeptide (TPR) repeat protein
VLHEAAIAHPHDEAPWLALARFEEEKGNVAAADQDYRRALEASGSREAKLRMAQFLARNSRIAEAEQLLAEVDHKEHVRLSTSRADFELLLGRAIDAVKDYTSALQRYPGSHSTSASTTSVPVTGTLSRPLVVARLIEADLALAHKQPDGVSRIQHAKTLIARYARELDAATSESLQAEIALVSGDLLRAQEHAKRALELAPDSVAGNFVAGLVQQSAGDLPAANRYWNVALEKDPDFLPARQAVAAHALSSGDAASAEEYIVPVVRDEPANFLALCIYARALQAKGELEAAKLIARRAQAADGSSSQPHMILGDLEMQQNRLASAFIQYQQAILLEPGSAEAMARLERVYRKGKVTRPMLMRMERVAGSAPASAPLMEVVGRLYAQHGWQHDAERALREAAKLDPSRTSAHTALALAYAHQGDQRAAADSLAHTGETAAELIAGARAAEQKDLTAAIRSYEAAMRGGESSGAAANNLAWIYAQRGLDLDRALELAQFAHQRAPQNPAVLDTLGFVQLRRREYSAAIATLRHAVELARLVPAVQIDPTIRVELRRHLAEAYIRAGQPEAAAALEKSLP